MCVSMHVPAGARPLELLGRGGGPRPAWTQKPFPQPSCLQELDVSPPTVSAKKGQQPRWSLGGQVGKKDTPSFSSHLWSGVFPAAVVPTALSGPTWPGSWDQLAASAFSACCRGLLPCSDQPAVTEGADERASLCLQHRGGRLPVWVSPGRGAGEADGVPLWAWVGRGHMGICGSGDAGAQRCWCTRGPATGAGAGHSLAPFHVWSRVGTCPTERQPGLGLEGVWSRHRNPVPHSQHHALEHQALRVGLTGDGGEHQCPNGASRPPGSGPPLHCC